MTEDNVWEEAIQLPPTVPAWTQQPVKEEVLPEVKGLPVRSGGDKIFILKNGKRFWVTSAEVYNKLGFKFGDEVNLDQATLSVIPEGEPLR